MYTTLACRKRLTLPDFTINGYPIWLPSNLILLHTFDTLKAKAISSMKNNSVIGKVDAILVLPNKTRRWSRL
jgi:hypothetical protein